MWKTVKWLLIIFSSFLLIGCSSSDYARRPSRGDEATLKLRRTAESYLGTPYLYGGDDRSGMDCSGLVYRVFREANGLILPHKVSALANRGIPVKLNAVRVGDLLFFSGIIGKEPSHVGIYLGQGRFIHASSSRGVVISQVSEQYYRKRFLGVRRMVRR